MLCKQTNFVNLLQNRAINTPDKNAFTFLADGETVSGQITYRELEKVAKAIASRLQQHNAKGERALLLYPPGLDFIAAFMGCLYAGVIATPAYPPRANRSIERLQAIVSDAEAKFALTTTGLLDRIKGRFRTNDNTEIKYIATDNIEIDLASSWQEFSPAREDLAFLQYTSGSTGKPKGVMVTHGNLIQNSLTIEQCFQHPKDAISVSWLPPYHDMGLIGGVLPSIYLGCSVILIPPVAFLQKPYNWLKAISEYGAITSGGANFAYDLCVERITAQQKANLDLSSWELAFSGAEPVRSETIERFSNYFQDVGFRKEIFYPCYGMAESTLIITGGNKQDRPVLQKFKSSAIAENQAIISDDREDDVITLVGCGKSVQEQELAIVNSDTLTRLGDNQIGEIWVASDSVAQGYWQQTEKTKASFDAYIGDTGEGPFLRTGDLGFLSDGELFVTGRLKDLIIIRGRNYYPQDLELSAEKAHLALRSGCSAAFSVDVDGEEKLAIAVEVKRTHLRKLNPDEVIDAVTKAIIKDWELRPHAVILIKTGSIPKTSSGKIQRHACKIGFEKNTLNVVSQWQQESISRESNVVGASSIAETRNIHSNTIQSWLIAKISAKLSLDPKHIDIKEPLINYGLDSVAAVTLSGELAEWIDRKISPTIIYDYPTIESLASFLSESAIAPTQDIKSNNNSQEIAIVGMGCRFPGANNPQEFWQLLRDRVDGITLSQRSYLEQQWGGFLENVDLFDPQFFGISPREASSLDPQQRLLLEVSWEALENAAIAATSLARSQTGVFIGISSSDYSLLNANNVDVYSGTGNAHSIAANRLSYYLDLRGPSLSVDTACSSSLVALHLACASLRNGECNLAIAGGVNLILASELTQTFSKAGMMAADGRCKTFDASADGYVRGEGCGIVILKPLDAAIQDGDNILAVIKGSAINQDGRSNGLTAPNGLAQTKVISQALANAKIAAADLDYIEAHGTGTSLGDPIEVNALNAVLSGDRLKKCAIGSVKTNIGHLEAAAGIAGLIKVVLSLQNQEIPANLHLQKLNPHINIDTNAIDIPREIQPWKSKDKPRLAGVSSFGFGGTNAHVILGEYHNKPVERSDNKVLPSNIFTLSAKTEPALRQLVKKYEEYLTKNREVELEKICFTTNGGRSHFKHRLALIADSTEDLLKQLKEGQYKLGTVENSNKRKIAFLFTGQGSQYAKMGYKLYEHFPVFRDALNRCAAILESDLEKPLLEVIYSSGAELDKTAYTQPALFALEYALAKLWQSWGISPDLVMGHSVGEYVAATIAGVFSLEDGLKLIAARAKLMQKLPQNGQMVAVFATVEEVETAIKGLENRLSIAAINGDKSIVISGESSAIEKAVAKLEKKKIRRLNVSHAFHSPLMDGMLDDFAKVARKINYSQPKIKLVSNLTGEIINEEIATAQYWVDHVRGTVKFAKGLNCLAENNCQIFLEIGPKPVLLNMARHYSQIKGLYLASLRSDSDDLKEILSSLSALYLQGIEIDWSEFNKGFATEKIILPNYPFIRQRYWLETERKNNIVNKKALSWQEELYQVKWQIDNKEREKRELTGTWLILGDRQGLGEKIAKLLLEDGKECDLIYSSAELEDYFAGETNNLQGIVHLWSLNTAEKENIEAELKLSCGSALKTVQNLLKKSSNAKIWFVTRGSQPVRESQLNNIAVNQSPIWGLAKVIALECPQLWGGAIDLSATPEIKEADPILEEIKKVTTGEYVAYRDGKRYLATLEKTEIAENKSNFETYTLKSDRTYLIAGGNGALGITVASEMCDRGAKYLALISRSGKIAPENQEKIAALANKGAKISIIKADIADESETSRIFAEIARNMPPLAGIIQAAGVIEDSTIVNLSWQKFTKVIAPKVQGTWNLHQNSKELSLDFFVTFSSAASLLGSFGQGNYAAANAYMDAIAHFRKGLGLPGLSINWGPWSEIGMASKTKLATKALNLIPKQQGIETLFNLIANAETPQIGVVSVKWDAIAAQFPEAAKSSYFQHVATPLSEDTAQQIQRSQPKICQELLKMSSQDRETFIIDYVRSQIAKIIQKDLAEISAEDNLLDIGADSIAMMEAIDRFSEDLQLTIYPREIYDRPKINVLGKYIATEFDRINNTTFQKAIGDSQVATTHKTSLLNKNRSASKQKITKKIPGVVFILSSPRSGSTLLRVMLAGHNRLCSPPELHLLPFETMSQREAELGKSHLGEGLQKALMELKNSDAETAKELVDELIKDDRSIQSVYSQLQQLAGDRILVDKSPTYAFDKETLARAEELFQDAKYIHLVRHPYSVIESFARMRMDKLLGVEETNPYELAESVWAKSNQNIIEFLENIESDRHCQINYEDLVTQPETVMKSVCQFLDLPYSNSLIDPYSGDRMTDGVHKKSMSLGDPNFLKHQAIDPQLAETWKTIQLPIQLQPETTQIATKFDYQLPNDTVENESPIYAMVEHFLEVRGIKVCLCTWGPPSAPLVLCLHGILEQGAAWSEVAVRLAAKGYRVIAPDLRGHGRSDRLDRASSYNLIDFLSDIDTIVETVTDKAFTLVGHSLGSVIAATFASIRPQKIKNLFLVETILPSDSEDPEIVAQQLATQLDYLASPPEHPVFPDVLAAADRLRKATPALSMSLAIQLATRITEPCAGGVRWCWASLLRTRAGITLNGIGKSKYLGLLRRIKAPITLIYGDRSKYNREEDLSQQQEAMPKAAKVVVSGGHNLHLEAASKLAQIIGNG
ncbi:MAG: alpha/beta fold hydrolase [Prochloraceae cyanobacterium]|nr:alpha/beta fold hydrolase [Prochloraceae cyanobacterium]